MAFTQQNANDGYLFFAVAFNAVPGKTYAAQVVEAYNAGLTTQQIVNNYTSKSAFTDIYGTVDNTTDQEFAQAFVSNVVGSFASAEAKAAAVADIEAALAAGLSRGDVVYNVIQNIASKSVLDPVWGKLVQVLNNKVLVAQALTEGPNALDTIDVGALQKPLEGVDETYDSVLDAIAVGGDLKALLNSLQTVQKAEADYAKSLGLKDGNGDAITDPVAVKGALVTALSKIVDDHDLGGESTWADFSALTANEQAQAIAQAKTDAANDVTNAGDAVKDAQAKVDAVLGLGLAGKKLDAAQKAADEALVAQGLANQELSNQQSIYAIKNPGNVLGSNVDGNLTLKKGAAAEVVWAIKQADGTFKFDAAVSADDQKALSSLLTAKNADIAAQKKVDATAKALSDAHQAVTDLGASAHNLLTDLTNAQEALKAAKDAETQLNKDLDSLKTMAGEEKTLGDLAKAVEDAGQNLKDAGFTLKALDGTSLDLTNIADLPAGTQAVFMFDAASLDNTEIAVLGTKDAFIYVGTSYTLNKDVTKFADLSKGDASVKEVFFVTNGSDTDVYIEKQAFGSNAGTPTDKDMIKVTLTGVAADQLSIKDGIITVAA